MLITPAALAEAAAQLRAPIPGHRFAVVPVEVGALDFVRAAAPLFGSARYLRMVEGVELGGVGTAWRLEASGQNRFVRLESRLGKAHRFPDSAAMFIGFSFAADGPQAPEWGGFVAAEAVLPAATVITDARGTRLVLVVPPGAEPGGLLATLRDLPAPEPARVPGFGDHAVHSIPSGSDWCHSVEEAVGAIGDGSVKKVVLARSAVIRTEMTIDAFETVDHLAGRNTHAHLFGWQLGRAAFVGASPELLVARHGDLVRANPLAGSAGRGEGDEDDRAVGTALMSSEKDRQEHALVVEDISERLRPMTLELRVPASPSLRRNATVQHLSTEISGRLLPGVSLLDLVGRLHPTPAVGGTPRREALAFIEKLESIDRGWYSGGVGWLNPSGDGEVAIALRCGLLEGCLARLYAGNGIVAGSDPESELVETRWKFQPMMELLTAT